MIVNMNVLGSNPFFDAYGNSDLIGKLLFISLIALSILSWVVLLYKFRQTKYARQNSKLFLSTFREKRNSPLTLEANQSEPENPFSNIYLTLRQYTVDLLTKNRRFGVQATGDTPTYLSPSDIDLVGLKLSGSISTETARLEKNLYLLSTVVTLGPFLGLLGTVWGILVTFSDPGALGGSGSNQVILGGISLALVTTVLGLVDAIPALIGYNYLKNSIAGFEVEMESFANEVLASVELQYRQVDIRKHD